MSPSNRNKHTIGETGIRHYRNAFFIEANCLPVVARCDSKRLRAAASAFEVSLRAVLKADALLGSPFFQTAQLRPATKGGTMMIAKTQT